jgi:hypothetical protein
MQMICPNHGHLMTDGKLRCGCPPNTAISMELYRRCQEDQHRGERDAMIALQRKCGIPIPTTSREEWRTDDACDRF